ncbi:DUF6566 family protein [Paraburkholderia atlantica]|nr:DUF6566 family protein [Paraburkholderia atlantica]
MTPEWLTEAEALRAGIEQGRYLIDRTLGEHAATLSSSQRRLDEDR